jgi:hypothetical protein
VRAWMSSFWTWLGAVGACARVSTVPDSMVCSQRLEVVCVCLCVHHHTRVCTWGLTNSPHVQVRVQVHARRLSWNPHRPYLSQVRAPVVQYVCELLVKVRKAVEEVRLWNHRRYLTEHSISARKHLRSPKITQVTLSAAPWRSPPTLRFLRGCCCGGGAERGAAGSASTVRTGAPGAGRRGLAGPGAGGA